MTEPARILVVDDEPVVQQSLSGEDLPHVFNRFYRDAEARGRPGSGLGLAIVRQVAEQHGGTVTALPAPGAGTLMRLRLPGAGPVEQPVSTHAAPYTPD